MKNDLCLVFVKALFLLHYQNCKSFPLRNDHGLICYLCAYSPLSSPPTIIKNCLIQQFDRRGGCDRLLILVVDSLMYSILTQVVHLMLHILHPYGDDINTAAMPAAAFVCSLAWHTCHRNSPSLSFFQQSNPRHNIQSRRPYNPHLLSSSPGLLPPQRVR